jgi:serine/threonine protein phosphatase PrpC
MTLPSRQGADGIVVLEERAATRSGALRLAAASHPGLVRERNEDRLHIDAALGLLMVVDGMGGAAAGEVAAETALARVLERLERRQGSAEDRVREAIASANNEIARLGRENPAWEGMGCVLTLALVEKDVVTVGHVGDTRLYRLRQGRIEKLTHDHSPIGAREDQGELDERDAMRHPRRNEVYRSLGSERHGPRDRDFVDVLRFPFEREAAILICSDGLSDLVPSSEMVRIVREHAGDERALVQRLVDAANAAGGKDNVSVVFAAGDRFAEDFPRAAGRGSEPAASAQEPRFWRRRSTSFVLGMLAGMALYGAVQLEGRWTRHQTPVPPEPAQVVATRHEVGVGHTYRTIGDALAASRSGDTVVVHPGRYREQVRLEEGVTLMASEPGRAVIAPSPPNDGSGPIAALVAEGLGGGRVSGLAIEGSAAAPIDYGIVIRRSAVTIEDVDVRGARIAGVAIENAGASALLASRVHDNPGGGIVVRGVGSPRLLHNEVFDNGGARRRGPR